MILKKFLGKTLDAAKKSARQMYGDDFVILESSSSEEKEEAGITVMVKQQKIRNSPTTETIRKLRSSGSLPINRAAFALSDLLPRKTGDL
jgi:flagellar biosynthesis GTPase FlhF